MKSIALIIILTTGLTLNAANLLCQISRNTSVVFSTKAQSHLDEKVFLGRSQGVSAYVTEKSDSSFLVEAYLENEDVRIYAQGPLKNPGEKVIASLWGRESLVDITCGKP